MVYTQRKKIVISALLTDLYQLTMAYGYWKLGMHQRRAVFHQVFRKNPFGGNYAVAAGLATVVDFLQNWHFTADDLTYLATLRTEQGSRLFPAAFLDYLQTLRFTCDIDAIPEGTVVFAHEPLLRITGPLLQGQLLESTLLNVVNFQTLIATKASRICRAAGGQPVLEFGLRRAQATDGALAASRAAYLGGCVATSNVLAGKTYGIPVRGTHAHSWVTAFPDEQTAFSAYATVMPHNCVLLVDTYDTLQGVKNAIDVGKTLRSQGADLLGIRLDSGDIATLSRQARALLDAAGFHNTAILASNSLDESVIIEMQRQGAAVTVWGVGTSLVTAYDQPALDGVYKLSALCNESNEWCYKLKLSETAVKISNPGIQQVRRFFQAGRYVMDIIYDIELGIAEKNPTMLSLNAPHQVVTLTEFDETVDLLQPLFREGRYVGADESLSGLRQRATSQVECFMMNDNSAIYPVGLEEKLQQKKQQLITHYKTRK